MSRKAFAMERFVMPVENAQELGLEATGECFFCPKPSVTVFINKKEFVELCAEHGEELSL